jgi:hypothetical protein
MQQFLEQVVVEVVEQFKLLALPHQMEHLEVVQVEVEQVMVVEVIHNLMERQQL